MKQASINSQINKKSVNQFVKFLIHIQAYTYENFYFTS